jgi:hypothetical protein
LSTLKIDQQIPIQSFRVCCRTTLGPEGPNPIVEIINRSIADELGLRSGVTGVRERRLGKRCFLQCPAKIRNVLDNHATRPGFLRNQEAHIGPRVQGFDVGSHLSMVCDRPTNTFAGLVQPELKGFGTDRLDMFDHVFPVLAGLDQIGTNEGKRAYRNSQNYLVKIFAMLKRDVLDVFPGRPGKFEILSRLLQRFPFDNPIV